MLVDTMLKGAGYTILASKIRLYSVQGAKLETQVSLRTGASVLSWALQAASATGGDLTAIGATSVTLRAVHAGGFVCSKVGPWYGIHNVSGQFADGDSVLAYDIGANDWFLTPTLSNVDTTGTGLASNAPDCFWGDTTSAPNPEVALKFGAVLTNLLVGAPVRAFHPVQFDLEQVDGRYWLVQRVSGATDPELLAGPLMSPADSGLVFSYYDQDGVVTASPDSVATVEIFIKAESRENLSAYVNSGNIVDTLRVRVTLRNR